MTDLSLKLKTAFKSPKVLLIAGLLGIVLIFLSSLGENSANQTKAQGFSVEEYKLSLQEDIEKMVGAITGSDDVSCVITLESSVKFSYADTVEKNTYDKTGSDDQSLDTEIKEGYITFKSSDGGEQALLITESMPEVRGVAIVCHLGDNEAVAEKIKGSVTAALNISSKKVYICGRNQ